MLGAGLALPQLALASNQQDIEKSASSQISELRKVLAYKKTALWTSASNTTPDIMFASWVSTAAPSLADWNGLSAQAISAESCSTPLYSASGFRNTQNLPSFHITRLEPGKATNFIATWTKAVFRSGEAVYTFRVQKWFYIPWRSGRAMRKEDVCNRVVVSVYHSSITSGIFSIMLVIIYH
jgi:hypothetical protein